MSTGDAPPVDFGGEGVPMLALHGSFGTARVFASLADQLIGAARLIAFDQRGHGADPRRGPFGRAEFVADAAAVLRGLDLGPLPVFGHSLGGITAYQLAARHPELVSALVIEDVGALMRTPEIAAPTLDVTGWPGYAPSRTALRDMIEDQGIPDAGYFMHSAVRDEHGWRLSFDYADMMDVQAGGIGDWWQDWLGSDCPALLLHGEHSPLLPGWLATEMVRRRPGTELAEFPGCGHWIHDDDPAGVARVVREFLGRIS